MNTVYANEIYKIYSAGVSEIDDTYETKSEVGDINTANSADVTVNADVIAILNTKQLQTVGILVH